MYFQETTSYPLGRRWCIFFLISSWQSYTVFVKQDLIVKSSIIGTNIHLLRGQTICRSCKKKFNNRALPEECDSCGAFLGKIVFVVLGPTCSVTISFNAGGSYYSKKIVKECDAMKVRDDIVSVRKAPSGRGSSLRVFVNISEMVCYAETCLSKYSTIPARERNTAWCTHLKEGVCATEQAVKIEIPVSKLVDLNISEDIIDQIRDHSQDGNIITYRVNKSTVVTPTFGIGQGFELTHLKDSHCKIKNCKLINVRHALVKRSDKICIHSLLVLLSGFKMKEKMQSTVRHKMDHLKTTDNLIRLVEEDFPTINDESLRQFLPQNTAFLDTIRYEFMQVFLP